MQQEFIFKKCLFSQMVGYQPAHRIVFEFVSGMLTALSVMKLWQYTGNCHI